MRIASFIALVCLLFASCSSSNNEPKIVKPNCESLQHIRDANRCRSIAGTGESTMKRCGFMCSEFACVMTDGTLKVTSRPRVSHMECTDW